jgi:hypothetical protein
MTQAVETPSPTPAAPPVAEADLTAAIHRVLASSQEPLTPAKLRAALPANCRPENLDELTECLRRQVAANTLYQFPKYRSQQDRFWDRGMPAHIAALIHETVGEQALSWSELRRKLPGYALAQAETVLKEQVSQGLLHRHPPATKRGGGRFGVQPPDPRDYLREELTQVFRRLQELGFTEAQLREGAMELLQEAEWAPRPQQTEPAQPQAQAAPKMEDAAPRVEDREPPSSPNAAPTPEPVPPANPM